MFIAIVGTRFSGKSTIVEYLVSSKSFTQVKLLESTPNDAVFPERNFEIIKEPSRMSMNITRSHGLADKAGLNTISKHLSFLSMSPLPSPAPMADSPGHHQTLCFYNTEDMLNYVTKNWRENFVTTDLPTRELLKPFIRRPFFLLVSADAPLLERFNRSKSFLDTSLEEFVLDDDRTVFGGHNAQSAGRSSLRNLSDLINISVINSFRTIRDLHAHLDEIDFLHPDHLRPSWDAYFMTLASLASRRSNCMKRRVGAILVRENRVLASGYNGTPRGLINCNEGGCPHCNGSKDPRRNCQECLCLHAEENALLEAGRDRVGKDCVLYCNTCPCLKCTVKIIQTGVKTVVYNLTYKVDDASAALFNEAGVQLRRYDPSRKFRVIPGDDDVQLS